MVRAPHTPESRQRLSEAAKARWAAQAGARAAKKAKDEKALAKASSKAKDLKSEVPSTRATSSEEKRQLDMTSSPSMLKASGDEATSSRKSIKRSTDLPAAVRPLAVVKTSKDGPSLKSKVKASPKPRSAIVGPSRTPRPVPSMSNEAIKPTTTGYNNVVRAQNEADKLAAAGVSEEEAEAARIARLKVEHFDLWSALYAEDEEIFQRPMPVKKAAPQPMSTRRR